MFRWDNFCEKWAESSSLIAHKPGKDGRGKRFFRMDTLDERMDITKSLTGANKCDLFMSVITAYDGELVAESEAAAKPKYYSWRRHALFWARAEQGSFQTQPLDELAAADAKSRAVEAAEQFIAFLDYCSDPNRGNMQELRLIDFFSVELATLPVAFNGWYICSVSLTQDEPRQLCVVQDNYDADLLVELFPSVNWSKAK